MDRNHRLSAALAGLVSAATPFLATSSSAGAQGTLTVPSSIQTTIGRVLPERSNAGAAYLQSGYSPNLIVEGDCQVRVIFFWESAGYRNSLGWFRYTQDQEASTVTILESGMLFPDVNQPGTLASGANVWLTDGVGAPRTFHAGDRIGFFIVADGWSTEPRVRAFVDGTPIPSATPATNKTIGRGCYTTLPSINPESTVGDGSKAQHVAMVRIPGVPGFLDGQELIVCGFEDLNRTVNSDDDFNDSVFLVQVTPMASIDETVIAEFIPTDIDGDGVSGFDDAFPTDPNRTYVQRIPAQGYSVIAFEDFYPAVGDQDYNDAVVAVAYTLVTNRQNHVKDLIGDFHLLARGASFEHAFGLNLHKLPNSVTGTVRMQRFFSGDAQPTSLEPFALVTQQPQGARIDGIFPSTQTAMPRAVPARPFANTWPGDPSVPAASARVWIEFDGVVATSLLGTSPYDPFLFVTSTSGVSADVHLPGYSSFADRSAGLPQERGSKAFLDSNGQPWALVVPTNWRFPLEGVPITRAYPGFANWRSSKGKQDKTWYATPTTESEKVSVPIDTLIPTRSWTLRGPADRF
ncbi:MAG: LruC domain-containing protein [Planctomycetes bacterium]|nr:LruC domain-containing protein [Planctomycetota bacterium]